MEVLNYSSYAQACTLGMAHKNMAKTARCLLGVIIDNYTVENTHGDPYTIDNKEAAEWYKGESDIYEKIKEGTNAKSVLDQSVKYFEQEVIKKLLLPVKVPTVIQKLSDIIDADPVMPSETKSKLQKLSRDGKTAQFMSEAFLYAVTVDNKLNRLQDEVNGNKDTVVTPESLLGDISLAISILEKLPHPVKLTPPDELRQDEMVYVQALLDLYSEDSGHVISSSSNIPSEYRSSFDRQRKSYYAAESVRESTRDSEFFRGRQDFAELKEEILAGVIDVCESSYPTGMERLTKTLAQASTITLASLLPRIPGWVGPNEKKGVCHMLVNDGEIRWLKK